MLISTRLRAVWVVPTGRMGDTAACRTPSWTGRGSETAKGQGFCIDAHTYAHTPVHTRTHTYIHTYTHKHTHTHIYTYTYTHTHTLDTVYGFARGRATSSEAISKTSVGTGRRTETGGYPWTDGGRHNQNQILRQGTGADLIDIEDRS